MAQALALAAAFLAFAGLAVASYTDLKARVVPNALTAALFFAALALHALAALQAASPAPLLLSLSSAVLAFVFAYALYAAGVWAGGDVKLFAAVAALVPVNPALGHALGLLPEAFAPLSPSLPLFPFTWFVFSALAFLPAGAVAGAAGVLASPRLRALAAQAALQRARAAFSSALWLAGVAAGVAALQAPAWAWAAALAGALLSPRARAAAGLALAFGALLLAPARAPALAAAAATAAGAVLAFALLLFLFWAGRKGLVREKKITQLQEGDIPAEFIYLEHGVPRRKPAPGIQTLIKLVCAKNPGALAQALQPPGHALASPLRARGLEKRELAALCSLVREGRLEDRVLVKHAAPMAPAMLLGFAVLAVAGDVAWRALL